MCLVSWVSVAESSGEGSKDPGFQSDNGGKGRPVKVYPLARMLEETLDELKGVIEGDYDKKSQEVEKVREVIANKKKCE